MALETRMDRLPRSHERSNVTGPDQFVLDPSDEGTAQVLERLEHDRAGWLTTVAGDGTPQSSPIWFIWDGDGLYLYSRRSARVRNIRRNPRVSFNLDGNRMGGKVVVFEGTAVIDDGAKPVTENDEYLAKYGDVMRERGWLPDYFPQNYPVFIRVRPTRLRHW